MKYSIEINAEDVTFIIEAIKLRAFCLADDIEKQAKNIKTAHDEIEKDLQQAKERKLTPSEAVREAVNFGVFPTKRRGRPAKLQEIPF